MQTPEFSARVFHADKGSVTVDGKNFEARALEYSIGTPPDGVSGPLVSAPTDDSPGCTASDYDRRPVQGAVVLVDRGNCPFAQKEDAAAQRGAVAVIVVDNVDEQQMGGTLGANTDVKIPTLSVTKSVGILLRGQPGQATVKLNASTQSVKARNIIAQTKTGSTTDVVMARRASGQRPGGTGHQRRRLRGGRGPGNRRAARKLAASAQCGTVRLLGCRGTRTDRVAELRRVAGPGRARRALRCI